MTEAPRRHGEYRGRRRATRRATAAVLALGLASAGCGGAGIGLAEASDGELTCDAPVILGALPRTLFEASGVTRDPRRDGLYWAHNDSGNPAELFALDTLGRVLAVVPVARATDRDIEDIATGPCPGGECLYLADIGDNLAVRSSITVHRLPLPPLPAPAPATGDQTPAPAAPITPSASWTLVYPGGARDAESLAIDPKRGELLVITKGREGVVELYTAEIDHLHTGLAGEGVPDTLRRTGSLAIPIGNNTAQYVTAADLSPDGRRLAVRSYSTLYEIGWPGSGAFDTLRVPSHAPLIGAFEAQGEGLAWEGSGESFILVSEGRGDRPPTISRIRCAPEAADSSPEAEDSSPEAAS